MNISNSWSFLFFVDRSKRNPKRRSNIVKATHFCELFPQNKDTEARNQRVINPTELKKELNFQLKRFKRIYGGKVTSSIVLLLRLKECHLHQRRKKVLRLVLYYYQLECLFIYLFSMCNFNYGYCHLIFSYFIYNSIIIDS